MATSSFLLLQAYPGATLLLALKTREGQHTRETARHREPAVSRPSGARGFSTRLHRSGVSRASEPNHHGPGTLESGDTPFLAISLALRSSKVDREGG